MSAAISFMSASVMPWVVTAGVPTRMPEAIDGGCGSYGIAFLFSMMPAASQRASASVAGDPGLLQVEQRQVGVGAAGDRAQPLGGQPLGERLGVGDDLAGVGLVLRAAGTP